MIFRLIISVLATVVLLSCSCVSSVLAFSSEELVELSAEAAVELLCSRQVTAVQYAQALLERAHNYSCINAFASLPAEKVRTHSTNSKIRLAFPAARISILTPLHLNSMILMPIHS